MPEFPHTINRTLPLQIRTMREYAAKRNWTIVTQVKEVGSGASQRELRETLIAAAGGAKSTWCWSGDWIAGAGPLRISFQPCKNFSISESVSFR